MILSFFPAAQFFRPAGLRFFGRQGQNLLDINRCV
jgi:hypothetical protein